MTTAPFLTLNVNGRLVLMTEAGDTEVSSFEQFVSLTPDGCLCSSSVDYPEEYTQDSQVLRLCYEIREKAFCA